MEYTRVLYLSWYLFTVVYSLCLSLCKAVAKVAANQDSVCDDDGVSVLSRPEFGVILTNWLNSFFALLFVLTSYLV